MWRRYFDRVETEELRGSAIRTHVIDEEAENDTNNHHRNSITVEMDDEGIQEIISADASTNDSSTSRSEESNEQISSSVSEVEQERDTLMKQSSCVAILGSYLLLLLWLQTFMKGNGLLLMFSWITTILFLKYLEDQQLRIDELNEQIDATNESTEYINDRRNSRRRIRQRRSSRLSGVGEIFQQTWNKFSFNSRASFVKKENFNSRKKSLTCSCGAKNANGNNSCLFTIDDDGDYYCEKVGDTVDTNSKDDGPECSICLDEYEKGDALVCLNPCHHVFHEECIKAWTKHNKRCPLCNVDLTTVNIDCNNETEKQRSIIDESVVDEVVRRQEGQQQSVVYSVDDIV